MKGTGLLSEIFMQNSPTLKNSFNIKVNKGYRVTNKKFSHYLPTRWLRVPPAEVAAGSTHRGFPASDFSSLQLFCFSISHYKFFQKKNAGLKAALHEIKNLNLNKICLANTDVYYNGDRFINYAHYTQYDRKHQITEYYNDVIGIF